MSFKRNLLFLLLFARFLVGEAGVAALVFLLVFFSFAQMHRQSEWFPTFFV